MTDLRRAIHTTILIGAPWVSVAEVAAVAGCDGPTALRELRRQVGLGHLAEVEPQRFRAGPRWKEYRDSPDRTRAGGNTKAYRQARAARDEIRGRAWEVARKGGSLTCAPPSRPLQKAPKGTRPMTKISDPSKGGFMAFDAPSLTQVQVALRLGVSVQTIRRRVAAKQIKAYRMSATLVRFKESDVVAYLERIAQEVAHAP